MTDLCYMSVRMSVPAWLDEEIARPEVERMLRYKFDKIGAVTTGKVEWSEKVLIVGDSTFKMMVGELFGYKHSEERELPLHLTEVGWPNCSTCDEGGCPDCTESAYKL